MSSYQALSIYHHGINVKHFLSPAVPSNQLGRQSFRKARKTLLFANGKWEFDAGVWIQRTCSFKNVNKQELFLNGSWEMIPGQKSPAGEGWPARFLYGRWELGNGKWEMEHRPVTMDHRKV